MADFTPAEAPAHEANSLPVMTPTKLVGRDLVLAKIYNQLKDNMAVLIYGPAGIGKTALAATLASAYTDLPGGVLWLHVENPALPELLVRVGRAYNVPEIIRSENPLAMIGAVANTLTQHKPLIVLDGKIEAQTAQDFITRCADHLPVLLVCEEQIVGPWASVGLERLERDQAGLLFKHLAGMDGPDGEENDADIDGLMNVLDYNPFAIAVSAGTVRATKKTPAEFLASLPQQPGITAPLLALTAAFRNLNAALQGLMLMMGSTFTGQGSPELLSMISGAPEDGINQAMLMLSQRQLIERFERGGNRYYRLHAMTYAFTQPLLRGAGKLDALHNKVRESVLGYARKHSSPANDSKLAVEMENLLETARWAVEQGDRDFANQLAVALMQAGDFVNARGYVYELLTLRRLAAASTNAFPAYGAAAAPSLPFESDEDEEEILEDDDLIEDEIDDEDDDLPPLPYDESDIIEDVEDDEDLDAPTAIRAQDEDLPLAVESGDLVRLRTSLAQARQQGNVQRQAEILRQMAQAQVQADMENEAISSYSEALTSYEALDDKRGILTTLTTLAELTMKTDNTQAAVLHASRGAQLAEQIGDQKAQARLLTLLGDARQQLGESDQAVTAYTQALNLARSTPEKGDDAMILLKLGYAQLDEEQAQQAVQTWEEALRLFREQGRRDCEGRVLGGLGTAYGEMNRWTEAINFHTSALHIAREVTDKEEEALELSNLGHAAVQAKQLGQAVLRYRQALHLEYQANNRDNIVSTIVDLVQLLVESGPHVAIAELLIDDAMRLEPTDRDVKRLKERVEKEKESAQANGVVMRPVNGTAQDYAYNAYKLLES